MYIITNYKETSNGLNINGSCLYLISDDMTTADKVLEFKQATGKGWASKKAIIVDFAYALNTTQFTGPVLQIADEVAAQLIAKYGEVKTKVYSTWKPDNKAGIISALCDYITDPYDRG